VEALPWYSQLSAPAQLGLALNKLAATDNITIRFNIRNLLFKLNKSDSTTIN
jgi:hypothetical protein